MQCLNDSARLVGGNGASPQRKLKANGETVMEGGVTTAQMLEHFVTARVE